MLAALQDVRQDAALAVLHGVPQRLAALGNVDQIQGVEVLEALPLFGLLAEEAFGLGVLQESVGEFVDQSDFGWTFHGQGFVEDPQ